jgi:hypothetical protein
MKDRPSTPRRDGSGTALLRTRWRSLVSLLAGTAIALMALSEAFLGRTGPDWPGLVLYLSGVAVAVLQWDGLFGAGAARRGPSAGDARRGGSGPGGVNALWMAA